MMADSEEEYRNQVNELTIIWDSLELQETKKISSFSSYFRKYKTSNILNHVSAKASRDAGFGYTVQTNNVPELVNALIKRWQSFRLTNI